MRTTIALTMLLLFGRAASAEAAPRRIDITVTEKGFEPKQVSVKRGEQVQLVFTRKTDRTCAKDVKVFYTEKKSVRKPLPLNVPVEIVTRFDKSGELGFTCGMDMVSGVIQVQ